MAVHVTVIALRLELLLLPCRWATAACIFRVDVFLLQLPLRLRHDNTAFLNIALASMPLLQSVRYTEDREVLLVVFPADVLDCFKDLITALGLETIIVLVLDVHNEL
jgi:hypothetical protein